MKSQYDKLIENPEFRKELAVESLVLDATETMSRLMEERKVSKADLARMLGKSRAWVTQLLNGHANMTLRTLAEVLVVLDAEARFHSRPGAWSASRPLPSGAAGTSKVQFQIEGRVVGTRRPEDLFRIVDHTKESVEQRLAEGDGTDDLRPEYAA